MTIYDVIRAFFCAVVAWVYGRYRYRNGYRSGFFDGTRVNVGAYKRFHDAMRGLGWETRAAASDEPIHCPFCGGGGLRRVPSFVDVHPPLDPVGCLVMRRTGRNGWCIQCMGCRATGPRVEASNDRAYPKAMAAWSVRARRTPWAQAGATEEGAER